MPAVSVLVPCYNVEKYIRQCLDSVVGQTLTDMEIICLNDGSTDGTLAILQEYAAKDSRVRIIDKPNSGYGDSMNKGLEAATGEYIGIVESDDWAEADMFESLYALAKQHDCDMVKSAYNFYWSTPKERRELCAVPSEFADRLLLNEEHADFSRIAPSIWSGIYRREMLEQYGIRFLNTPGASYQDTGFHAKTWMASRSIWVTSKAYLQYRQDNMNASVKSRRKIFAVVHEFRSIERFLAQWNLEEEWEAIKDRAKFKCYSWNYNRLDFAGRKRFLPVMRKEFGEILSSPISRKSLSKNALKKLQFIQNYPVIYLLKTLYRDFQKSFFDYRELSI